MRCCRALGAAVLILALSLIAVVQAAEPAVQLSASAERPDALYKLGEKARFLVRLEQGGKPVAQGEIAYQLDKDGMPPVQQGKLKVGAQPLVIAGTLAEPGFLRCRVSYVGADKKALSALASAGFDPLAIKPSLPPPDDFDAFWTAQKAKLAAVPMKPQLTPVKQGDAKIECFDLQIPCAGPRPVSGYFARPAGAPPKSLPAILYVHGAGVRGSSLGAAQGGARLGCLALDINAHGIPNGKPDQYYKDLNNGELNNYRALGRESRDECYFLGMFLRLMRAMDFLTSQPEWDGRTLIATGSSQGGGQAIAAAGLNPRVTLFAAGVPAICDHSGKAIGRINGWPKLVPDVDGQPDPKVLQVARYFDCMNFASRAQGEAVISVGFIDGTCPPSSVYAAYNAVPGKKRIVTDPLAGHKAFPAAQKAFAAAIEKHIAERKAVK